MRTFEDRYRYLAIGGRVGRSTFGYDRWVNQEFYTGRQWRQLRDHIIVRDNGCDLGVDGHEIRDRVIIHHMNPLSLADLLHNEDDALNPEFLISVSHATHNAIHYGDERKLAQPLQERRPGDTQLWSRR